MGESNMAAIQNGKSYFMPGETCPNESAILENLKIYLQGIGTIMAFYAERKDRVALDEIRRLFQVLDDEAEKILKG
jgi:hypothetical protein